MEPSVPGTRGIRIGERRALLWMLKSASEGFGRNWRVSSERSFQAEVKDVRSRRTKGIRGAIVARYHDCGAGGWGGFRYQLCGGGFGSAWRLGVLWRRGPLPDSESRIITLLAPRLIYIFFVYRNYPEAPPPQLAQTATPCQQKAHFIPILPLPLPLDLLLCNYSNNILVGHHMAQSHPLWDMPGARAPHQRILEALLQRAMHLVTHVLDGAVLSHDQGFAEVGLHALPLRVYPHEVQLLPGAVDDVADAEVELAGHDNCVVFVRELIEELHRDAVDFVVDVETGKGLVFGRGPGRGGERRWGRKPFDVFTVGGHDHVDKVVDRGFWDQ